MTTVEPTHADDAQPGQGPDPRIPQPTRLDQPIPIRQDQPIPIRQDQPIPIRQDQPTRQDEPAGRDDPAGRTNPAGRAGVTEQDRPAGSLPAPQPSQPSQAPQASRPPQTPRTPQSSRRPRPNLPTRLLRHPVTLVTVVAGVLHVIWFFTFANSGGDLAAQDAWAEFVGRHPDSAYNLAWYGGMHPVSYSVVSPYLMSVLGVRTTMMIAGTVSAGLLTMILMRSRAVRKPLWPAFAGVFGLLCNAASGRVTFGLGMVFGLGATAVVFCWPYRWRYKRWAKGLCAAPLAALATMASPVAGLFVGLVAAALFLQKRLPGAWSLGIAPTVVVGLSAWLFPFSGTQPMSFGSAMLPMVFAVLVALLVPKEWITVRITAWVYALGVLLVWLISSQIGSNVTRLSMLFAGVALLAALPFAAPRSLKWYAIVLAFVGFTGWIGVKTVNDVVNTTPEAAWARELAPLVNQLQAVGADKVRVEVVPARSHREASALAPYVNLARGWNRQADMERNPLFYDGTLNSANYHEWLKRWAVHYVVLPQDDKPDGDGAERERELVQRGMPYLKQIWGDANWQLFEVQDPTPLAGPNTVVEVVAQDEMTLEVQEAGRVVVRIPYSPWLSLVDAEGKKYDAPQETELSQERRENGDEDTPRTYDNVNGCLMEAEEDAFGDKWTELLAPSPGTYRLAAPYGLRRGTPCPEELR